MIFKVLTEISLFMFFVFQPMFQPVKDFFLFYDIRTVEINMTLTRIKKKYVLGVLAPVAFAVGLYSDSELFAAEPPAYHQANVAAQSHAANPSGWSVPDLKTITAPGDGNSWYGSKVLVRAFTNPAYYNLTTKKNQNLYPSALWVTTGNELPAWYRDLSNGVNASNISLKTVNLLGLPTSSMGQYNAIVEILVEPSKIIRPTKDPSVSSQPSALPTDPFAARPANLSEADYIAYKAWYVANITSSYGSANPDNQYPWTQLGYTYNWGGDQSSLASIRGLSEFAVLGTKAGVTSPIETFAVYSIQSYIYKTGSDGDGVGNFNVTGSLDTLWSGTKFQPAGNSINIARGAVVNGGEGIYISSNGYTVTNNGAISGPTALKYYGDAPAGTSVYFLDGGTFVNGLSGIMTGDDIAIGGSIAGAAINIVNHGYLTGNSYAVKTGSGNDSLTIESGGIVENSVSLGSGSDLVTIKSGGIWQPLINRQTASVSTIQSSNISLLGGSVLNPVFSGNGLLPATSSHNIIQGSVSGSFSTLQDQYPLFDFSISHTAGGLDLVVTRVPYSSAISLLDPALLSISENLYSQIGTATGDMALLLSNIDSLQSPVTVAGSMRQLSPFVNTVIPQISFLTDRARLNRLQASRRGLSSESRSAEGWSEFRYASLPPSNDADPSLHTPEKELWKGFFVAAGGWGSQNSKGMMPGFTYNTWSSQAGMQKNFGSSLISGFALGGSQTSINNYDIGGSSLGIESINPSIFSSVSIYSLTMDLLLGYNYNSYNSNRRIVFNEIDRTASGSYDGHQLSTLLSVSYRFFSDSLFFIEPVAGVYFSGLSLSGYQESGAGAANLRVNPKDSWSLQSHIGSRIGTRFKLGAKEMQIQLTALWEHEYSNSRDGLTASFSGSESSFSIEGMQYDKDSIETGLKMNYLLDKELKLFGEYIASGTASSISNSLLLGFEWLF